MGRGDNNDGLVIVVVDPSEDHNTVVVPGIFDEADGVEFDSAIASLNDVDRQPFPKLLSFSFSF